MIIEFLVKVKIESPDATLKADVVNMTQEERVSVLGNAFVDEVLNPQFEEDIAQMGRTDTSITFEFAS